MSYGTEYNREYYRQWRKDNREHLAEYHKKRRERLRQEADPEEMAYLTAFRKSKGMNTRQFAEVVGVSQSYIYNMEHGVARMNHERIRAAFPDYMGGVKT